MGPPDLLPFQKNKFEVFICVFNKLILPSHVSAVLWARNIIKKYHKKFLD